MTDTKAPTPGLGAALWAIAVDHWGKLISAALTAAVAYFVGPMVPSAVARLTAPAAPSVVAIETARTVPDAGSIRADLAALKAEVKQCSDGLSKLRDDLAPRRRVKVEVVK